MIPAGIPIVLSAPSGGGKSTIADHILKEVPSTIRSISYTTRAPRPGEKNGKDYFFISKPEFEKKVKANDFLEWAEVHQNFYGTPRKEFENELQQGRDVILTIDPQGAAAIKKIFPQGIYIFICPPTWDSLHERLVQRGTDDKRTMEIRIQNAKKELSAIPYYDYLVVNDELEVAVADVAAILRAEHRRIVRVNKNDIPIFEAESA